MAARVWLNVDLGELPGEPEDLYACAHVANVACGGHAGDEASMQRAVILCGLHGAALGAHPSYPDREGFGRRRVTIAPHELRVTVGQQCARLAHVARMAGASIDFVKPHGALYHVAHDDDASAEALVSGAREALGTGLTIIGPPRGALAKAAASAGLPFAREGFADRATRDDGTLVPRGEPDALVVDPDAAATRAAEMVAAGAIDTICVHGDTPGAVAVARAVRAVLDALAGAGR
jgi:UPF0271 protein